MFRIEGKLKSNGTILSLKKVKRVYHLIKDLYPDDYGYYNKKFIGLGHNK